MKMLSTLLVVAFVFLSCFAQAQQASRWEFGVFGEFGRDWYHKDYPPEINPEWVISDFSTERAWGTGVYAERSLNTRWSVLGQVSYAQKKVHPQLFHYPSQTAAQAYSSEIHYRGAFDAGLRCYVNPKSKVRFFVEGKLGANVFISAVQQERTFGRIVNSDVFNYQRVLPVASASAGFKWWLLTVSAEYRDDLIAAKRDNRGTSISGRGVFGKVAFTVLRVKNH